MAKYQNEYYFIDPIYGATSAKTSGTYMKVTLGPLAGESTHYGSKTGSTSIPGHMGQLNSKDYTISSNGGCVGLWVAGHLLNDNLGGCGKSGENLTPLTKTANRNHATYEGRIKDALIASRQMQDIYKVSPFIVGVEYTVQVSTDTFGPNDSYDKAPSHITITGTLVKADKKTRFITPLGVYAGKDDFMAIPKQHWATFKNAKFHLEIHNDDKHLIECDNGDCEH